jgi:hypothetical protein
VVYKSINYFYIGFVVASMMFTFNNQSDAIEGSNSKNQLLEHFVDLYDTEKLNKINMDEIVKENSTWVFFQTGCDSCHTMMKNSSCFTRKNNKVYFVGVLSDAKSLLNEARENKYKGPVLFSKSSIEGVLNLKVTPTVFIFKKDKLAYRHDNYISCTDIIRKL